LRTGWRDAALNQGWTYRDRVSLDASGSLLSEWMARRYSHSPAMLWRERISNGELGCNGQPLAAEKQA